MSHEAVRADAAAINDLLEDRDHLAAQVTDLQTQLALTAAALAECEAQEPPPPPPPPPPPDPLNIMATDVPQGWKVAYVEPFDLDCAEGQFRAVYGPRRMGLYPRSVGQVYNDTRRKQYLLGQNTGPGGIYTDQQISVKDGICTIRMNCNNGITRAVALLPIVNPRTDAAFGDAPGMIWEITATIDLPPSFKVAWLLWPITDRSTRPATEGGGDGEIDFPELTGSQSPRAYVHHQGASSGTDQKEFTTAGVNPKLPHRYRTIWRKGVSCEFLCDGIPIAPVYTTRIPAKDMHLVIQCETALSGTIDPHAVGTIKIGGIRALVPV